MATNYFNINAPAKPGQSLLSIPPLMGTQTTTPMMAPKKSTPVQQAKPAASPASATPIPLHPPLSQTMAAHPAPQSTANITPDQYSTALHVALNTPAPASATPGPKHIQLASGVVVDEAGNVISSPFPSTPAASAPATPAMTTPEVTTPTMPVPRVTDETQTAIKRAESNYASYLSPSKEEQDLMRELDSLDAAKKLGLADTQDQPIALPFITGQQASIERRAGVLAEPLQQRAARMQAQRQAALESSKFALDRADKQAGLEQDLTKPTDVDGNIVQYDPKTGTYQTLYKKPTEEKENKPIEVNGQLVMKQPDGTYKSVFGAPKPQNISDQYGTGAIGEYNFAVANGYKGSFSQYQNEDANRKRPVTNVSMGGFTLGTGQTRYDANGNVVASGATQNTATSPVKDNALSSAQNLLTMFQGGNKFAVGGSSIFGTLPGTKSRDFVTQFNNLKSLLSLDNIKLLKGQGAVSDAERNLLAQASSKLELSQSEAEFENSLGTIIKALSGTGGAQTSNAPTGNSYQSSSGKTYTLPY
jgi:hypothetical protein